MANITTLKKGTGGVNVDPRFNHVSYTVDNYISFADVTTAKGSAIAASDTIEALVVPPGTVILNAGVQCIVPDNATALTLDLGFTGGDVDEFVDGFDHAAAAAGAYSAYLATDPQWIAPITTEDTIDLLIASLTDAPTVGQVRVWAILQSVAPTGKDVGIAQVGS